VSDLRFEWDAAKAPENERRHGVTFDEAVTIFCDEQALLIDDPDHSHDEERFILLGLSETVRVLLVVHVYRADDEVIRLISARKATRAERARYDERRRR
jgi:uncharacterized protein